MRRIEVPLDVLAALIAVAQGYPVRADVDRFIMVENPEFQPDNGEAPTHIIDIAEFIGRPNQ